MTATFQPKMLINSTRLPKSTIGDEIRKENVTPRGSPALVNPMNNGIETHRFHETEQIKMLELGWTYGYAKKSILDNKNIS